MQIEIEPSIRQRVGALNQMAAELLDREGWPVNSRLEYHEMLAQLSGTPPLTFRRLVKQGE